jgi:hypothetical protein
MRVLVSIVATVLIGVVVGAVLAIPVVGGVWALEEDR